jgi:hypothetical protein
MKRLRRCRPCPIYLKSEDRRSRRIISHLTSGIWSDDTLSTGSITWERAMKNNTMIVKTRQFDGEKEV